MEKSKQMINLIDRIRDRQEDKFKCIEKQDYEGAANAKDEERTLSNRLDELSGVDGFFNKVYESEKVLVHLEEMVNSMEEVKKLRPKFPEILNNIEINKILVTLYKQRDVAYSALLDIRENIK